MTLVECGLFSANQLARLDLIRQRHETGLKRLSESLGEPWGESPNINLVWSVRDQKRFIDGIGEMAAELFREACRFKVADCQIHPGDKRIEQTILDVVVTLGCNVWAVFTGAVALDEFGESPGESATPDVVGNLLLGALRPLIFEVEIEALQFYEAKLNEPAHVGPESDEQEIPRIQRRGPEEILQDYQDRVELTVDQIANKAGFARTTYYKIKDGARVKSAYYESLADLITKVFPCQPADLRPSTPRPLPHKRKNRAT